MNCIICGAYFDRPLTSRQIYCPDCRRMKRGEREREREAKKRREADRRKPEYSVLDIQRMADAAGMSYGEYVKMSGL